MRPIRSLLVSLVLAATIAALALGTASATFPGHANGRIAFGVRLPDGSANIFSINPDGTAKRQLTTGAGNHLCAAYEPNGRADALLRRHQRRLRDLDDEGERHEPAPGDPPQRLRDVPGHVA